VKLKCRVPTEPKVTLPSLTDNAVVLFQMLNIAARLAGPVSTPRLGEVTGDRRSVIAVELVGLQLADWHFQSAAASAPLTV
jgi:hypothetical protein